MDETRSTLPPHSDPSPLPGETVSTVKGPATPGPSCAAGMPTGFPEQTGETVPWPGAQAAGSTPIGDAPPGYEVLGHLGRGGMGVVYRARQIKANRIVALKMIRGGRPADIVEKVRFQIEVEAIARLQHPHIVQLHDAGEHNGQPFFSLELCEGGSLDRLLKCRPLSADEAAALVEKLARAAIRPHTARHHSSGPEAGQRAPGEPRT